jgi:hypothetical protein
MVTFIRYALAAACFAASVGCLALWGWSFFISELFCTVEAQGNEIHRLYAETSGGFLFVGLSPKWPITPPGMPLQYYPLQRSEDGGIDVHHFIERGGRFGRGGSILYSPLWYPALVFALVGVGVLRFRRQFSIRSALITFSVVAALLGMVVVL